MAIKYTETKDCEVDKGSNTFGKNYLFLVL